MEVSTNAVMPRRDASLPMRWNLPLRFALAAAVAGLVLFAWGSIESATCQSTAFMGCFLVGVEQIVLGLCLLGAAALLGALGAWLAWRTQKGEREPRAEARRHARTIAEVEAELAAIERELARIGRVP